MKIRTAVILLASMIVTTSAVLAVTPEYTAMKTGCKMIMDGILDEPAWQKAQSVGAFKFQWYESGEQEQTEAKILWDKERIYFSFKCNDKHISAERCSPNTGVAADDCCEAFISPVPEGPERLDYINYEVNCIGTWLTGYHAASRNQNLKGWEGRHLEIGRYIKGTCNKDDDIDEGWVLEFSVPWEHFKDFGATFPPKNGQVIYVGLHRCGGKTNPQYSQWSPSQTPAPNYHRPQDFGKVTFSTKVLK
ncbi:MAG: carbohydrate-binding family 9-like protein [Candidatus Latescibacterota bacterium]